MSSATSLSPNPLVRALYDDLGELLARGDDVFVERGPALLQTAIQNPAFFDGVDTDHAPAGEYTRAKVIGDPGEHVIRFMEWPPGYCLLPHEHHGRPCFEVLVDGLLAVVDVRADPVGDDLYELTPLGTTVTRPGDAALVDPRVNDVHAVYAPVRSRSLHVYPDDNSHAYGYCLVEDDSETDRYRRKRFSLTDDRCE